MMEDSISGHCGTKMETCSSPIQEYFGHSTIFVVGATGLLGSLLIEKLLRTCTNLKKIYILLRLKKGVSSEERFKTFFDRPVFEKLKATNPELLHKVYMVTGDCSQENLGLNENDLKTVTTEVNCIFYSAANMNFEGNFRMSVVTNVSAVRKLFNIAKEIQHLNSIVYISTIFFYGWKDKNIVYEEVDETNIKLPEQLEALCDNFDDECLEKFKSILIDNDTNIYSTTKWAAEILIKKLGEGLPMAIVRPSMVTPTLSDPIPGWVDNFYGPIGAFICMALGIIRAVVCKYSNNMDIIPADYVANCMIASAWDVSRQSNNYCIPKNGSINPSSTVKIYNCATSSRNPVTCEKLIGILLHHYKRTPYSMQIFYDKVFLTSNIYLHYISKYILCLIPLYIMEFISFCILQPTNNITAKVKRLLNLYEVCLTLPLSNWVIRDDNVRILWQNLQEEDKMLYNFDVLTIDWDLYCKDIVEGLRIYLLKDPLETVPKAVKRRAKLKKIFYFTAALVFLGLFLIIVKILG